MQNYRESKTKSVGEESSLLKNGKGGMILNFNNPRKSINPTNNVLYEVLNEQDKAREKSSSVESVEKPLFALFTNKN